jgi:hypothetical protein
MHNALSLAILYALTHMAFRRWTSPLRVATKSGLPPQNLSRIHAKICGII